MSYTERLVQLDRDDICCLVLCVRDNPLVTTGTVLLTEECRIGYFSVSKGSPAYFVSCFLYLQLPYCPRDAGYIFLMLLLTYLWLFLMIT